MRVITYLQAVVDQPFAEKASLPAWQQLEPALQTATQINDASALSQQAKISSDQIVNETTVIIHNACAF
jgi:hypothetical protein